MKKNYEYRVGGKAGKKYTLKVSNDLVAVRINGRGHLKQVELSKASYQALTDFQTLVKIPDFGVQVLQTSSSQKTPKKRDKLRGLLKKEDNIKFAGRCLQSPQGEPVLYTENLFIKFYDTVKAPAHKKIFKQHELSVKRVLAYAKNTYFVSAKQGCGLTVFDIAASLLELEEVELCHPELVQQSQKKIAFDRQWHLKKTRINGQNINAHANVEAAWALSEGNQITIAVIDDGVDLSHKEFTGSNKIVAPRDVTLNNNNANPRAGDRHGTACAGVACANGVHGASGVAPKSKLMPIRLASQLGSQAEADAFVWAADHGADVISCSWGPVDGRWWDASDPLHNHHVPIPDSTRLAIDYAIQNGRNGKGCVITWAAGNGNEPVENDGYASYQKVIAVAACNDQSKKSAYSDKGNAIWCAFPSSHGEPSLTTGIWTTDNSGSSGYNIGDITDGDLQGDYTNSFGGTSSACPGAAGIAALILARNPDLRWDQVKDILKQSCDKIDSANGNYNSQGHSPLFGYGRLNAKKAVELAAPQVATASEYSSIHKRIKASAIKDNQTTELVLPIAENKPIKNIKISVDIKHTWIGDLVVKVKPPASLNIPAIVLHDRQNSGAQNIVIDYDSVAIPKLNDLHGLSPQGTWKLQVSDHASRDQGSVISFGLLIDF